MKHRLIAVDLLLLVVLVVLGWAFREKYREAKAHEQAILLMSAPPASVPGLPKLNKVGALDATAYQDAVAKNLFSRDRNPTPIPDPPPPPPPPLPQPPFPIVRGVMLWDGVPPTIVMSAQKGPDQRGYHPGERVGEWKILSVDNTYVVLEWSGQQFKKRIDELMDRTPLTMADATPQPAAPAAVAPQTKSLSSPKDAQGPDMGAGNKACTADDKSAPGTVLDGRKKIVSETPFGSVCRWETVSQP